MNDKLHQLARDTEWKRDSKDDIETRYHRIQDVFSALEQAVRQAREDREREIYGLKDTTQPRGKPWTAARLAQLAPEIYYDHLQNLVEEINASIAAPTPSEERHPLDLIAQRFWDDVRKSGFDIDGWQSEHSDALRTALESAAKSAPTEDTKRLREAFLELIDAHYGTAYHHIGDGDGIPEERANELRSLIAAMKGEK